MLVPMDARLYVVHGSHPCVAIERALDAKGMSYKLVELPPPMHVLLQRLMFGGRTVPGMKIDGQKVHGSTAIMRRLDELVPEPPLFPSDPDLGPRVEEAERWGEATFQPLGRRFMWNALKRNPRAAPSYAEHSKLPLPKFALAPITRLVAAPIEIAMNKASDDAVRADFQAMPGHLDRIDAWIADGTLGGETPNAADFQIASTVRLLMSAGDLRPLIQDRPAGGLALRLFEQMDGEMPAGTFPREWIPAAGALAAAR